MENQRKNESIARNALRRAFSRSPVVIELMDENKRSVPQYKKNGERHKVDSVEYLCNICKKWKKSTKGNKVAVDHIEPVVDPYVGFINIQTYYERMYVGKEKLQVACGECHLIKTNSEREIRMMTEYKRTLDRLEKSDNNDEIKKEIKKFTKKRLSKCTEDIKDRIIALKGRLNP